MAALRDHDEAAWREFCSCYGPRLRQYLQGRMPRKLQGRFDIDDVVQHTFLKAYERLREFDYRSEEELLRYLRRIGMTKLQERVRHHGRRRRAIDAERPGVDADRTPERRPEGRTPSSVFARKEQREALAAAIAQLGHPEREIVWWRVLERRSWKEVARELSCTPEAARSRFCRAVEFLAIRVREYA